MKYDIASIETKYKGVTFRSRLEAHWAAFFDEMNWDWIYEPFDMNGWFPDFLISNNNHGKGTIPVEVKPFLLGENLIEDLHEATKSKIRKANAQESLLVGIEPFIFQGDACIGHLINSDWNGDDYALVSHLTFTDKDFKKEYVPNHYDLYAHYGHYIFKFSREYDGDHHLSPVLYGPIIQKWHNAKTKVSYKK